MPRGNVFCVKDLLQYGRGSPHEQAEKQVGYLMLRSCIRCAASLTVSVH
jgi:hypothetical protein